MPIAGLKGLPPAETIDLRVTLGYLPEQLSTVPYLESDLHYVGASDEVPGEPSLRVWRILDGRYFRLRFLDGTVIVVERNGLELWATWPDHLTLEDTATYLLGPIMGFVLRLRGTTCLHASAVAIDGQAIVLVGRSGAGKSSTAAALAQRGYAVLSDDVVALADFGTSFAVHPAYPRLRLWPESASALFGSATALAPLTPNWDKLFLDLTGAGYNFQDTALPLGRIYILEERGEAAAETRISKSSPREALVELVTHANSGNFLDSSVRAVEFELLSRVVAHTEVMRVKPPDDLGKVEALCQAIVHDLAEARN